jgi:hypothetical protein
MIYRSFSFVLATVLSLAFSNVSVLADDVVARQKFEEAKAFFAEREDLSKNEQAITALKEAEAQAQDADLKYDILTLASRAQYWKGMNTKGDEAKKVIFDEGKAQAKAAQGVNQDYAEAYYFYAINLGRWAEANGVIASLMHKGDLIRNAEVAIEKETRDGEMGETVDGYGPARTLGRMYFKLPGWAGGSLERSINHLETAFANAKDLALNVVYYAEALNSGNQDQKKLARQILDDLLKEDPNTYNPNRTPETKQEFELARQLRKEMGN